MMRIAIDCFKLIKGHGKSIGIYNLTKNLIKNLSDNLEKEDKIIVLGNEVNKEDFSYNNVEFVEIPLNPNNKITCVCWELVFVSWYCRKLKIDKTLFPRGFMPIVKCKKATVIIHDLIPFYYNKNYPLYFNFFENMYIMWRLKASIIHSYEVITISNASRNEIMKYSKKNRAIDSKIKVVYNGKNNIPKFDQGTISKDNPYIVAVTSKLPHKNAKGILLGYQNYCKRVISPLKLVLIGIDSIEEYNIEPSVEERIKCIKYIEDDQAFYQIIKDAYVFLFLSIVEGFGFPPIEAMELGVPVICSECSSLPEIVGDGAILVNPESSVEVANAIITLNNTDIRNRLIHIGTENIKRFDWKIQGKKYYQVLFEK